MSGVQNARRPRIGVPHRHRYRDLQALEDAIAYRQARLTVPCPECKLLTGGARCDEHACDVALIAAYQEAARGAVLELACATSGLRRQFREALSSGSTCRDGA